MTELTGVDVVILAFLLLSVPALVRKSLRRSGIPPTLSGLIVFGGIAWVVYAFASEDLMETFFNLARMDSWGHARMGREVLMGTIPDFWNEVPLGNKAYVVYLASLHGIGASVFSARAINGFAGFAGGLVLMRCLSMFRPVGKRPVQLLLLALFLPSTVFWTSCNMKEGLVYWSACQILAASFWALNRETVLRPSVLLAVLVCGFLRPHICLAWLISVFFVALWGRNKLASLVALAAVPVLFSSMQTLAQTDLTSIEGSLDFLEQHAVGLSKAGEEVGGTIPILSGLFAIFFRPFIWESRGVFMALCSIETLLVTFLLFRSWIKLTKLERRSVTRLIPIRAAAMCLVLASVLFSYIPNDGLLSRQRVQVVPAILALTVIPFLVRYQRERFRRNGRRLASPVNEPGMAGPRGDPSMVPGMNYRLGLSGGSWGHADFACDKFRSRFSSWRYAFQGKVR
ncbi:MAG: hypothetical protein HY914_00680 [Desulfomonile tiedjei]|nr:hypothetical protein [Desulfomonile tiedjei]